MHYSEIKYLKLIRTIAMIFPLKRKLNFLISQYLINGKKLNIPFSKGWNIFITVTAGNHSTISNLILEGSNSQPEGMLLKRLQNELPDNLTMIDVGGNIGSFFCQFINKCKKVYVFEPIPSLHKVIQESISDNECNKVSLITKAVGDKPGHVKMLDNNNSNVVTTEYADDSIIDITITTLDNEFHMSEKIDFIKIDVEGYECHVLEGAENVIQKHKPFLLIEVHPGFIQNYNRHHIEIINFLERYHYTIEYFSFLEEERLPKWKRIIQRWSGNKGVQFQNKDEFLKDVELEPKLMSYHLYCTTTETNK